MSDKKVKTFPFIEYVNNKLSLGKLLRVYYRLDINGDTSIRCPFHDDSHKSAKYYEKDNCIYCFTCKRIFKPYDVLKDLDINMNDLKREFLSNPINTVEQINKEVKEVSIFIDINSNQMRESKFKFMSGDLSFEDYLKFIDSSIVMEDM